MCGRFTVVGEDDLGFVVDAIDAGSWDGAPDDARARGRLDRSEARPTALVQVVANGGGTVSIPMIWGFSVPWQRNVVFNARIERAGDAGGMWSEAFAGRRCIVPAWTFFEPHRHETAISPRTGRAVKRQYAFASPDGAPLLLAGIYDRQLNRVANPDGSVAEPPRFSIVTTAPTDGVSPIHDRMPLVLDPAEARAWLEGAPAPLFADRSRVTLDIAPETPAAPPPGNAAGSDQLPLFDLD